MATSEFSHNAITERESSAKSRFCFRCHGLMVVEQGFDLLTGAGPTAVPMQRCVQCGEVVDPVILQNRRLQDKPALGQVSEVGERVKTGVYANSTNRNKAW